MIVSREGHAISLGPVMSMRGTPNLANDALGEDDRILGNQVFTTFVEETVKALIDKEESTQSTMSSLRVFCRVDVGVWKADGNIYHYFVNEVERTVTVGLYRKTASSIPIVFLRSAVRLLPQYIEKAVSQG